MVGLISPLEGLCPLIIWFLGFVPLGCSPWDSALHAAAAAPRLQYIKRYCILLQGSSYTKRTEVGGNIGNVNSKDTF